MTRLTTITPEGAYARWSLNERIQHWTMAVSFVVLVVTGFALRYPESWWMRPWAGLEAAFNLRGLLHRIAGTVFLGLGLYHGVYLAVTARGRALTRAFRPRVQDVRDLSENIAYNLSLRERPPEFGHFSYMEKAEYLALIWGTVIMAVTGLMLWFDGLTLRFFSRWVIDLVTVIHFYEAWLAALAILVWHFYYVIFAPDIYPLNTSMITGRISNEEMRQEHYEEWCELGQPMKGGSEDPEREALTSRNSPEDAPKAEELGS